MQDLAFDPLTDDLYLADRSIHVVEDVDYVVQKLKVVLRFFLGEWFLDITVGVPYYDDFFKKNPNIANLESILKAKIVGVEEVVELTSFATSFDAPTRAFDVSFKCVSIYGPVEFSETLFI